MKMSVNSEYLQMHFKIMKWFGIWPYEDGTALPKWLFIRILFGINCFTQASAIVVEVLDAVMNWGNMSNPVENVYVIACSITSLVKSFTVLLKRKDIQRLCDNLTAVNTKNGNEYSDCQKKIIVEGINNAKYFTYVFMCITTFVGSSYFYVPHIDARLNSSNGTDQERPVPYAYWVPYDSQVSPLYEITYCCLASATTTEGMFIAACDSLVITLLIQLSAQFKVLQLSLHSIKEKTWRNLEQHYKEQSLEAIQMKADSQNNEKGELLISAREGALETIPNEIQTKFETELKLQLKKCIEHHQVLIRSSKELEHLFNTFMLVQLMESLVLLCFTIFNLTNVPAQSSKFVSSLVFVVGVIVQIFFFCWYSEDLAFQSVKVHEAAYNGIWPGAPRSFLSSTLTIMNQAQKPCTLTAAQFCPVNLSTFMAIMRLSYSNYALLCQLSDGSNSTL